MISPAAATSCCKLLVVECTASKVWISGASSRSFSMGSLLSDARCRSNCNSLKSGRESKSSSGTRKSDDLARDWEIWRLSKLHRTLPVHIDDELRSWFADLTCSTTITKFTVPPLRKISTPSQSYCAKWLLLYKDCRILFPAVSICATYWKTYWKYVQTWKHIGNTVKPMERPATMLQAILGHMFTWTKSLWHATWSWYVWLRTLI